jgi:hypothetical protein
VRHLPARTVSLLILLLGGLCAFGLSAETAQLTGKIVQIDHKARQLTLLSEKGRESTVRWNEKTLFVRKKKQSVGVPADYRKGEQVIVIVPTGTDAASKVIDYATAFSIYKTYLLPGTVKQVDSGRKTIVIEHGKGKTRTLAAGDSAVTLRRKKSTLDKIAAGQQIIAQVEYMGTVWDGPGPEPAKNLYDPESYGDCKLSKEYGSCIAEGKLTGANDSKSTIDVAGKTYEYTAKTGWLIPKNTTSLDKLKGSEFIIYGGIVKGKVIVRMIVLKSLLPALGLKMAQPSSQKRK